MAGTNVDLVGAQNTTTQTDAGGIYQFVVASGNWRVVPRRSGSTAGLITLADVQAALEARVGLQSLSAVRSLACDVSANGSVAAYDAALILNYINMTLASFPPAGPCASDWVFVPMPTPVANSSTVSPVPGPVTCQQGAIRFDPLSQSVDGQNFQGIAFGDCDPD
jgi:hypothetical protein